METHALLINLRRSANRLEFQTRQFGELGLAFERLDAVDAAEIAEREFRQRSRQWQRPLSRPEVGCFLSHRLAWQQIVRANRPLLVFEDDVILSENLVTVLAALTPPKGPLVYNLDDTSLPDLLVCRSELAEQILGFVRRHGTA